MKFIYLFTQLSLFRLENSMYVLVGHLSGHNAQCQLEAARCLHELSNSPHPGVGQSCLSATPYLLTYLSSPSAKLTVSEGRSQKVWLVSLMYTICTSVFYVCMCNMPAQELCLYTLGNLWPEDALVKEKLLVQGIVPALANCIQVTTD